MQIVVFDGGEYNFGAGEFNELTKLPREQWDAIRNAIKAKTSGKPTAW
jgi:hypothetical protein